MSKLTNRVDALEEKASDTADLEREFWELARAVVNGTIDEQTARTQAEPIMERLRAANKRKPQDLYLAHLIRLGEAVLINTPAH